MLEMITNWLKWLMGYENPTPINQGTVGNNNTLPETSNPNHQHLNLKVDHVNDSPLGIVSIGSAKVVDLDEEVQPMFQSLIAIPGGGVLTKKDIISGVLAVEGGYVNNPDDKGGETNFGITAATAKENIKMLQSKFKWDGKMKSLTRDMAFAIYEAEYWARLKLDDIYEISPFLADKLFDLGVNVGKSRGAKWLQEALNAFNRKGKDYADITADGSIGNQTLTALKGYVKTRGKNTAVRNLLKALICRQGTHYITISLDNVDNETFTNGWFDRLEHHLELYFK